MDPKHFYDDLWLSKNDDSSSRKISRDWFHRYLLDPVFDPHSNTRQEVALSLLSGGDRLLDIGCWDGSLLEKVQSMGIYEELFGVDIVSDGVEKARAKGLNASTVDLNTSLLPFDDLFFTGITFLAVLEHIFDPYLAIKRYIEYYSLEVELIIAVPNVASFTNRLRILFGRLPVTSPDPGWDGRSLPPFLHQTCTG